MKFRDILILLAALTASIVIALVAHSILMNPTQKEAPQNETKVEILVAKLAINSGATFSMDQFEWQEWPQKSLNPSYITKNSKLGLEKLVHAVIRHPMNQGEPLVTSNIIRVGDKSALAGLITPGMRAFTIPLQGDPSVSDWITAGDWVDVVIAQQVENKTESKAVVTHAKVLAVDDELEHFEKKQGAKPPKTITIEVTPDQAEQLASALKGGGNPVISLYGINPKGTQHESDADAEAVSGNHQHSKEKNTITIFRGEKISTADF